MTQASNPRPRIFLRPAIRLLKLQDKKLTGLAMRAMKWMGHSERPIHPKHLYDDHRNAFLNSLMKPGMVFLDVGSGSGSECLNALNIGAAFAYGIEINKASITLSHSRLKEHAGKFEILELNLEEAKLPLVDNSIDLISFSNVLEHLHNRQGILKELRRVLKPGGQLYISIPNTNTPWKQLQRAYGLDSRDDEDHKIEYSRETLADEMARAGFEITTDLHPIVPSLPVNGLIALTAPLSPKLYQHLQNWKHDFTIARPQHSIGWYFLAAPLAKSLAENQKSATD